jgi:hypothetical protein
VTAAGGQAFCLPARFWKDYSMVKQSKSNNANELLRSVKAPHLLGIVGYSIVLGAFVLAVINAILPEPNAFIAKILTPLIFVGLANLLYHIGQHVHALHTNVIRMAMMGNGTSSEEAN